MKITPLRWLNMSLMMWISKTNGKDVVQHVYIDNSRYYYMKMDFWMDVY